MTGARLRSRKGTWVAGCRVAAVDTHSRTQPLTHSLTHSFTLSHPYAGTHSLYDWLEGIRY